MCSQAVLVRVWHARGQQLEVTAYVLSDNVTLLMPTYIKTQQQTGICVSVSTNVDFLQVLEQASLHGSHRV